MLEPLERLTRIEPELVQRSSSITISPQLICLTAGAVEREHQPTAQPLPVRMLGDQRLQLADQLQVAAEREIGLDPPLQRRQPEILQASRFRTCKRLVPDVGQRRTTPAPERLTEDAPRPPGSTLREQQAALLEKTLEPLSIEAARGEVEHVSGRARLEQVPAERLAQTRDVSVQGLGRGRRRLFAPQLLDQLRR